MRGYETLYSSATSAGPALLIALAIESRGMRFHKSAPRLAVLAVRVLNWAGFIGCGLASFVSIRELAGLASGSADHLLVAWGLTVGLVAVVFVASAQLAWSDLGGLSPWLRTEQTKMKKRAKSRRQ